MKLAPPPPPPRHRVSSGSVPFDYSEKSAYNVKLYNSNLIVLLYLLEKEGCYNV